MHGTSPAVVPRALNRPRPAGAHLLLRSRCLFLLATPFALSRRPQTVQLLIYFTKLLSTEKRLVSLNCIFERAPVEAQSLLTYT